MPVARQQGFRRNQVYAHEFSDESHHQTEAPPPPPHSPKPSYVEDHGYYNDFSDEQAPPPPCHSPRPMDVTPGQHSRNVSWTNQADVWKERRKSAGAMLRQSWHEEDERDMPTGHPSSPREPLHHEHYYADEGRPYYRQNEYQNHYSYGGARSHSYVDYDDYADNHSTFASSPRSNRQGYGSTGGSSRDGSSHEHSQWTDEYRAGWEAAQAQTRVLNDFPSPPRFYGNYNQTTDPRNHYHPPRAHTYDGSSRSRQQQPHHPPHPSRALPRPTSQHSELSHHSHTSRRSLAEELHPDHDQTPSPSGSAISRTAKPLIGRYSGGLEYNYDRYARGFDGSAGSRSASTAKGQNVKRDGKKRSSWLDMESYGVDLGDVPAMSVPVGVVGSKMMYH